MTEVMGGRRHISVLLALFGAAWLPYGDNYEKDGMRHLLRQLRPFDGGAYNGSDVDSVLVSRPLPPETSTHSHASARHGGRRMKDVSYVRGGASSPGPRFCGWLLLGAKLHVARRSQTASHPRVPARGAVNRTTTDGEREGCASSSMDVLMAVRAHEWIERMTVAVRRVVREARGSSTSIVVRFRNGTRGEGLARR